MRCPTSKRWLERERLSGNLSWRYSYYATWIRTNSVSWPTPSPTEVEVGQRATSKPPQAHFLRVWLSVLVNNDQMTSLTNASTSLETSSNAFFTSSFCWSPNKIVRFSRSFVSLVKISSVASYEIFQNQDSWKLLTASCLTWVMMAAIDALFCILVLFDSSSARRFFSSNDEILFLTFYSASAIVFKTVHTDLESSGLYFSLFSLATVISRCLGLCFRVPFGLTRVLKESAILSWAKTN